MTYLFVLLVISAFKIEPNINFIHVVSQDYELAKPAGEAKAVLILFGGYPQIAEDIKREFDIFELAESHSIAVLFMNFNQKLWLETLEKEALGEKLQAIFEDNDLPNDKVSTLAVFPVGVM